MSLFYIIVSNFSNTKQIINICLLFTFSVLCAGLVFITWSIIYGGSEHIRVPLQPADIPSSILGRGQILAKYLTIDNNFSIPSSSEKQRQSTTSTGGVQPSNSADEEIETVVQSPSKLGNFIYSKEQNNNNNDSNFRLVCYYEVPGTNRGLEITEISSTLCTHLNVGVFDVQNSSLVVTPVLRKALQDVQKLKLDNPALKILLWVGAAFTGNFSEMVHNHANRKVFIKSLKAVLEEFRVDGLDIDWEFPDGMSTERIHFAQLLHEIRREYQREHRTYLISLAVAAPSILVDLTYDVREINDNVDYVNLMSYDFHYYSSQTPWTGLNSPLYKKHGEGSVFAMMNINYSVNYWETRGLDRRKIVVGLPTYGHTFKLVNPFNTKVGAPAEGYGRLGTQGKNKKILKQFYNFFRVYRD